MTMLVTLAEAKAHLRIDDFDSDGNPGDDDLTLKIMAASRAVLNYIGADQYFLDSSGEPISTSAISLPDDISIATLLLVGDLYRNRDGDNTSGWSTSMLPTTVQVLLSPYRSPVLA